MDRERKTLSVSRRRARRRQVAELHAEGRTVPEIAADLKVAEQVVRNDLAALRRECADREPWSDRDACAAAWAEDAERVLQKVRAAQKEADKSSGAFANLVKLEFAILIRFIETVRDEHSKESEVTNEEDFTKYSNAEILEIAKDYGIDTTPFERALGGGSDDVPEAA